MNDILDYLAFGFIVGLILFGLPLIGALDHINPFAVIAAAMNH